ncbi:MAG: anti-sigma factor antagonist [Phycisphaerales bacterium]|nr:anti-sigma factor antagonist [Phycisphaerales bacterium]
MKLSYEEHGMVALVVASGDCTGDASERLRRTVADRFAAGARSVILDFAAVPLVDSAALETMLWMNEETARSGGALRLVAPQEAVLAILRLTRLADRFESSASVELAARSLR